MQEKLKPNRFYLDYVTLRKGELSVTVRFANLDAQTRKKSDSYVVNVRDLKRMDTAPVLLLPSGVAVGTTLDAVRAAYGSPTKKRVDEPRRITTWTYQKHRNQDLVITFDSQKLATEVELTNAYK